MIKPWETRRIIIKQRDVVIADFPGAVGSKRRPCVVLSNDVYHAQHPDVILGIITSNISAARGDSDYVLLDWREASLRTPSAFRTYVGMRLQSNVRVIGRLTDRDWQAVRECLRRALA